MNQMEPDLFPNLNATARLDLDAFFDRLVPKGAAYFRHSLFAPSLLSDLSLLLLLGFPNLTPIAVNGYTLSDGVGEGVSLLDLYDGQVRRFNLMVFLGTWAAAGGRNRLVGFMVNNDPTSRG